MSIDTNDQDDRIAPRKRRKGSMSSSFLPIDRMLHRVGLARNESDISYLFDLLYLGELVVKLITLEVLAGMPEDRENHRYSLEYRLARANSIGEWAAVLDDALTGPASQHLVTGAEESRRVLTETFGPTAKSWQRKSVNLLSEAAGVFSNGMDDAQKQRVSIRRWVAMFVALRNRTRGHGAITGTDASRACLPLSESISLITDNLPAFSRPWAHLFRSQSGKYRVSAFGGDRTKFAYLTSEVDHSLSDGAYVYIDQPRRVPLLYTDSSLRDFRLPNGNYRSECFETISYLTDDVQDENGHEWAIDADSRPFSETKSGGTLDIVGNVFSNMPDRRSGYITRKQLEDDLISLLRNDRYPVVTLQGRGGVGKTSLALEVLHQMAEHDDYFAIVWFSARDIDLLPQGPKVVRADVLSTDDIARDFASLLNPEISGIKNQRTYLTDCLAGQAPDGPFLFVFDNFETIRDPSELYGYLDNAIRLPNKILITTRTRKFKADYPVEVGGMTRSEFDALVANTAVRLEISNLITSRYRDELFTESGGHPYITKVLLGEVARSRTLINPRRLVATSDAMLDALFERSYATLSSVAQRVFLTMCAWRSLVPRIGLEAVLLRPSNERLNIDRAIEELEQASLVEYPGKIDGAEAFISVPLAASEFGKRKLVTSSARFAIEADLEILRGFGAVTTTEPMHGIRPRLERMARGVAQKIEAGIDATQQLAVIEYIATAYPPAWIILSELQEQQLKDMHAAIGSVNRYIESSPDDKSAWKRLVQLYQQLADPQGEMNARLQYAESGRASYTEISATAARLNYLLHSRELSPDADEKRIMIRKMRTLLEARHSESNATDLSRLAWMCVMDQDLEAARKWTEIGLKKDPESQHCLNLRERIGRESNES